MMSVQPNSALERSPNPGVDLGRLEAANCSLKALDTSASAALTFSLLINLCPTFSVCLCFNDLTDASWPHSILGGEGEFVPGATLEVLQPIGALAWTDGEVPPLLAVILRVLQNVAFKRRQEDVKEE